MANQQEESKNRTVLIAVDGSEHSDRAFDCEYGRFRDWSKVRLNMADFL